MTAKPVIGAITYGRGKDPERFTLPCRYVDCIAAAGGTPIMIPPLVAAVRAAIKMCDGFVMPGGGDIAPETYGEAPHPRVYGLDPERDEAELYAFEELLRQPVPTLAICRGMQVLNVARGGSLMQHIPDDPARQKHRQHEDEDVFHSVRVQPQTLLCEALGVERCEVSSQHHQAAARLGRDLVVSATADDGTIEALEVPGVPMLAVQWHPEDTAMRDPIQMRLFEWLVREAQK